MFTVESPTLHKILSTYKKVWALSYASALLDWDYETYMPRGAAKERGEVEATITAMIQELFLSNDFRRLVHRAEKEDLNDLERGIVRVLLHDLKYYERVPREVIEERERIVNRAKIAWRTAKEKADFKLFASHLQRIVDITRKIAEYLGYENHPYDALLDLYEEGLKKNDVERMFSTIRDPLRRVLREVAQEAPHPLEFKSYCREAMESLNREILDTLGFDWVHMRVDTSAHPFTEGIGLYDVRITTWYHPKDFKRSLFATIHEFGHAVYDAGSDPALWMTPVQGGVSLGVHESQSRFWENVIARTPTFVRAFFDTMTKYLPFLRRYSEEEIYAYFTWVRPQPIRVEADEVTYNFHIMLRFELEVDLLDENVTVNELPLAWNEKMEKYLGIVPKNDAEGVLQDIHWSMGSIGYFPTYSIGNILAAQIASAMEKDLDLQKAIEERRFGEILNWLRAHIHRWGRVYPPRELIRRATGEEMNPEYFVRYIRKKYARV